jgi:hypothetical protein
MSAASGQGELCGHRWPLHPDDWPTDHQEGVLEGMSAHRCGRSLGHFGPHRCPHDGEEQDR